MTPAPSTKWVRKQRKQIKKARGGHCQVKGCTSTKKMEMAHTRPTTLNGMGRGSYQRLKDWTNKPKSYKLVCYNHARAMDKGENLRFTK